MCFTHYSTKHGGQKLSILVKSGSLEKFAPTVIYSSLSPKQTTTFYQIWTNRVVLGVIAVMPKLVMVSASFVSFL